MKKEFALKLQEFSDELPLMNPQFSPRNVCWNL